MTFLESILSSHEAILNTFPSQVRVTEAGCMSRPLARRGLGLCSGGTVAVENGCRSTVTIDVSVHVSVHLSKRGTNMKAQDCVHGNRNETLKTKACKQKTQGR